MLVSKAVQPALSMPTIRSPKASYLAWLVSVPSSIAVIAVSFLAGPRVRSSRLTASARAGPRHIDRMV
jgi:hypothetical protein